MPCSLVVKMLDPAVSCQKFERSISVMETAHEEVGGLLEKEQSVLVNTSGGPVLTRRELKVDATNKELDLARFLFNGNHLVICKGGDQGGEGDDGLSVTPGSAIELW